MQKAKAVAVTMEGEGLKEKEPEPEVDWVKTDLTLFEDDTNDLHNMKMRDGLRDPKNIKFPFHGYDDDDERNIQNAISKDSEVLLEIVQDCELEESRALVDLIHAHSEPSLAIPFTLLPNQNGSEIRLRILKTPGKGNDPDVLFPSCAKKPLAHGWKREVHLEAKANSGGEVIYTSPTGETFSTLKELDSYLKKNPSENWSLEDFSFLAKPIGVNNMKKELVVIPKKGVKKGRISKATSATKRMGQVKGVSAVQIKSNSTRRAIQPPKRYATGETQFHPEKKSRPAAKPESEEAMTMGMLPPRYNMNPDDTSPPGGNSELKKRGRPPKPKMPTLPESPPESEFQQTMYESFDNEGEEGDGLFQISALQYADSLLNPYERDGYADMLAEMQEMVDMEKKEYEFKAPNPVKMRPKTAPPTSYSSLTVSMGPAPVKKQQSGQSRGGGRPNQGRELLPCSIRCPGMTGEVPSLQCKRCLCLYHPRCIGLPANLPFIHFLCSNCEAKGARVEDDLDVPMEMSDECSISPPVPPTLFRKTMPQQEPTTKKWSLPTLNPPKVVGSFNTRRGMDNSGFQSIGQGGMSVKRLDTVTGRNSMRGIGPGSMGRGGMKMSSGGTARPRTAEPSGMSISPIRRSSGAGGGQTKVPSKFVVPQLSRTFSIVPISIPIRGPKPQVPDLSQRILNLNSNSSSTKSRVGSFENRGFNHGGGQLGMTKGLGGGKPMQSGNSGGGMIPHIPKKVGPPPKIVNLTNGPSGPQIVRKWTQGMRKPLMRTKDPYLSRYPQKVISLGAKKLVVVNRPPAQVRSQPTPATAVRTSSSLNSTTTSIPTSE